MVDVVRRAKALVVNPLKVSQPVGASLAFLGLQRAMPLEHGSRGCTAFNKLFFMRHFREPIALQTTAMDVTTVVMGADENVIQALSTICKQQSPEVIGLITTGLPETQGADVPSSVRSFRQRYPQWANVGIVLVSASDTLGCLETGYAQALQAIIEQLVPADGLGHGTRRMGQVNILVPSMFTPGDVDALKEWVESFGLTPIVLPDIGDSLDGHMTEAGYSTLSYGGTSREQLGRVAESVATLVIGDSLHEAANALRTRTGVPDYRFPHLTGLAACDAFTLTLNRIAGDCVPPRIERQRAQLLDAMVDSQFSLGAARIAVAADPDLLAMLCQVIPSLGADIVTAISATMSRGLPNLQAEIVMVGDLEDLEREAAGRDVHLIITNSHGVDIAARLGCGLLRAGYPLNDFAGIQARQWIGYRGTRQLLFDLVNALQQARACNRPYHARLRQNFAQPAL
jgi:nitrogenase molybdenum-iron cofactor biosynthesis protein NifN